MVMERVPADIRAAGGVARLSDPSKIKEIQKAVTIPVMAKCRIGHFVEAQILEAIKVDFIDESEVLTPADAALCMQLGVDGVFVGSGIFKSSDPAKTAIAIVDTVAHFNDAQKIAKASENLGEAMKDQEISTLETKLASRGI